MDPRDVQSIPLFAGLSRDDQKVVAQYADEVDVDAGKVLAQEGRLAYEFFAIREGTAEVTLEGSHAASLGPGDFFGEIGLVETERRTASVVATTPMDVIVMYRNEFEQMKKELPTVADQIQAAIRTRLG